MYVTCFMRGKLPYCLYVYLWIHNCRTGNKSEVKINRICDFGFFRDFGLFRKANIGG